MSAGAGASLSPAEERRLFPSVGMRGCEAGWRSAASLELAGVRAKGDSPMSLQLQGRSRPTQSARRGARPWPRRRAPLPARICVVEDDHDIREALEDLLQGAGYEPTGFSRAD